MTYILGQEKPPLQEVVTHVGVKGMHWGVRKKEDGGTSSSNPKTVSPEVQKKREAAAKSYEDKAANYQIQIDKLKQQKTSVWNRSNVKDQINYLQRQKDTATKNAENKRQGKLTEQQKTAIKGAAIVVGVLAAYGTYRAINSGQARSAIISGRNFLTKNDFAWKQNPDLAGKDLNLEQIMMKVVHPINKGYGQPGTKVNCRRCTFAYEMRRRGFDVEATRTTTGAGQTYKGLFNVLRSETEVADIAKTHATFAVSKSGVVEETTYSSVIRRGSQLGEHVIRQGRNDGRITESIFRELGQHPEGARGELGVKWRAGGAHSVVWEIIGGKPVVIDCQSGKKYTNSFELFGNDMIDSAAYTRLDNRPLNDPFLRRWVKNA